MKNILIVLFSCLSLSLSGQVTEEGPQDKYQALAQDLLLNGKQYRHYYLRTKGKQYITEYGTMRGKLWYEGVYYEELLLNYDIYNDLVFVIFGDGAKRKYVILNEAKIEAFDLEGLHFVKVREGQYEGLEAGIYEEVILPG
ncbi:MAG: hypothetical protein AAGM67_07625, partial [Bacteroidota bacterium]